jgi:hypothetical protein
MVSAPFRSLMADWRTPPPHATVWPLLAYAGTLGLFVLFLRRDIHWGFLLVPFLLVWLTDHAVHGGF